MTKILINTVKALGSDVTFVDRRFSRSVDEIGAFGIAKIFAAFGLWLRLTYSLARERPEVVVFFSTTRTGSFLVDSVVVEILRFFRVDVINYIHTVGYKKLAAKNRLFNLLVARHLRLARTTVCLAQSLTRDISPWVPEPEIAIISNTLERPPRAECRERAERLRIFYLSNLIVEKGADAFVELAVRTCRLRPDVEFVVAGSTVDSTFLQGLRDRVLSSGLGDRIHFTGPIEGSRKWAEFARADVFVFPSRYPFEAQPLVVLEALATGTPVVCYDVGSLGEVIRDGITGFVVGAGHGDALSEKVMRLLNDEPLRQQVGVAGRRDYENRFSARAFSDAWKKVLTLAVERAK